MSDGQDNFYPDYGYQSSAMFKQYSESPPPNGSMNNYMYQGGPHGKLTSHYSQKLSNPNMMPHMMGYGMSGGMMPVSAHHQKQLESAQKARQESSQHHHARVAASQSRMNMNLSIGTPTSNGNLNNHPRSSEASLGPRTPVMPEKMADWTALDLGGMLISNLSSSIFAYEFLTCLYLNHNNLRFVSPDIRKLKFLVTLNLTGNKLTVLPPELGLVVTLKELLLFDNQIFNIPPEFGQLYQLEMLGLEGNPIADPTLLSVLQKDGTHALIMYLRDSCPSIFC